MGGKTKTSTFISSRRKEIPGPQVEKKVILQQKANSGPATVPFGNIVSKPAPKE